jgi:hypothetical protein
MTLSMYQASVPVFVRMLGSLEEILKRAAAHAEAKGFDPAVLVNARLYPDMFALARQVQIATDQAKGLVSRLAGQEPPPYEDNETTFDELIVRIKKTVEYVSSFSADQIDGTEDKDITFKIRDITFEFKGMAYLLNWVMPNLYFHITTAYNILRHNGVEIGKRDFLGGR